MPKSATKQREILITSDTIEDLLVRWLNELISLFFTYQILPRDYSLSLKEQDNNYTLCGIINYYQVDSAAINQEVKAATYHNLLVEKTYNHYTAEVIFDV